MRDMRLSNLPRIVKLNGITNGDDAVKEITEKLRSELGDGFDRVRASDFDAIRTKYYKDSSVNPAAHKVLDVVLAALRANEGTPSLPDTKPTHGTQEILAALSSATAGPTPSKTQKPVFEVDYAREPVAVRALAVEALAVDPAHALVVTQTEDKLRVVGFEEGGDPVEIEFPGRCWAASWAGEQSILALGVDNHLHLWDLKENKLEAIEPEVEFDGVVVSRDGTRPFVLTRGETRAFFSLDLETRKLVPACDAIGGSVSSFAFEKDSVVALPIGFPAKWIDTKAGRVSKLASGCSPTSVALRPDAGQAATGSLLGKVELFELTGGNEEVTPTAELTGRHGTNEIVATAYSPDGTVLFSADKTGCIVRWDLATKKPVGLAIYVGAAPDSISMSEDGRILTVIGRNETRAYEFPATPRP